MRRLLEELNGCIDLLRSCARTSAGTCATRGKRLAAARCRPGVLFSRRAQHALESHSLAASRSTRVWIERSRLGSMLGLVGKNDLARKLCSAGMPRARRFIHGTEKNARGLRKSTSTYLRTSRSTSAAPRFVHPHGGARWSPAARNGRRAPRPRHVRRAPVAPHGG